MVKIETVKGEYLEFKVFCGAAVYTLFEKEKGVSIMDHFKEHQTDIEAMALALYLGHIGWTKLTDEKKVLDSWETVYNKLDADTIALGLMDMIGLKPSQAVETKKK
tara:strand:+ start:35145 stop:35462 length:318 start_codon:yes stop_codon:yes gene_type:complete